MQTLGLSDSTPRTESRLKSLFWPTIRNEGDVDYLTQQGFWICFVVAVITLVSYCISGSVLGGVFESTFFFLSGIGIREKSRIAAVGAFSAYLLSAIVLQRYTGQGFGLVRVIFLVLLLANIRGISLSARWPNEDADSVPRLNVTLGDKLSDSMPKLLWPKTKYLLYVLTMMEIGILVVSLFAPTPKG